VWSAANENDTAWPKNGELRREGEIYVGSVGGILLECV